MARPGGVKLDFAATLAVRELLVGRKKQVLGLGSEPRYIYWIILGAIWG